MNKSYFLTNICHKGSRFQCFQKLFNSWPSSLFQILDMWCDLIVHSLNMQSLKVKTVRNLLFLLILPSFLLYSFQKSPQSLAISYHLASFLLSYFRNFLIQNVLQQFLGLIMFSCSAENSLSICWCSIHWGLVHHVLTETMRKLWPVKAVFFLPFLHQGVVLSQLLWLVTAVWYVYKMILTVLIMLVRTNTVIQCVCCSVSVHKMESMEPTACNSGISVQLLTVAKPTRKGPHSAWHLAPDCHQIHPSPTRTPHFLHTHTHQINKQSHLELPWKVVIKSANTSIIMVKITERGLNG